LFDKLPANACLLAGDFSCAHPAADGAWANPVDDRPRITVNFENAGKLVIDGNVVELEPADVKPG